MERSAILLLVLGLCLGCASRHFVSPYETVAGEGATSDTPRGEDVGPAFDEHVRSEAKPSGRMARIGDALKWIASAQEAAEKGKPEEALAALDQAFGLLSDPDVEPDTGAEVAEAYWDALKALGQAYQRIWPSVVHLSMDSPLSALLGISDMDTTTSDVRPSDDLVTVVQKIRVQSDVPVECNERVQKAIELFLGKGREPFSKWLSRSGIYVPMMREILADEGVPEDFVYLSMIESGFTPRACSAAGAGGLWQFMPSTGGLYGLRRDWFVDERRDPVRSTRAAARYLKDLYKELGDWYLVLAAYNCGKGRVLRAMRKGHTSDYWQLDLPRETRGFVPHFLAALIVSKAPDRFGFEDVEYEPPLAFEEVEVGQITLDVAAECASSTYGALKALNPELRRWCTPPQKRYHLKVPKGTQAQFLNAYASLPPEKRVSWYRHKVAGGETVSALALRYGTSQSAVVNANSLRSMHRIRAGSHLLIPVPSKGARAVPAPAGHRKTGAVSAENPYVVKKDDTLGKIALEHGITVERLKEWNPAARSRYIHPGDALIVRSPTHVRASQKGDKAQSPVAASTHPEGSSRTTVYVVKRGDTLDEIARNHGVTVKMLREWNAAARRRFIYPGDRLAVLRPPESLVEAPAGGPGLALSRPSSPPDQKENGHGASVYVVRKGDTLWEIADSQGVTVGGLIRSNGLDENATIYPGDELRLPQD